jgi:hypothetical protein
MTWPLSREKPSHIEICSNKHPFGQHQPLSVSPYPTDPISQPIDTTNDQRTLSQETILKIQELKRLVYTYPIHSNPDAVIKCVTYFSINGDNTILDEKLEELRSIDAVSKD